MQINTTLSRSIAARPGKSANDHRNRDEDKQFSSFLNFVTTFNAHFRRTTKAKPSA
jgi:hypothetical protein